MYSGANGVNGFIKVNKPFPNLKAVGKGRSRPKIDSTKRFSGATRFIQSHEYRAIIAAASNSLDHRENKL